MSASFCWQCGRKLEQTFATVVDPLGSVLRVHHCCKEDALRVLRPITAQETEKMPEHLWTEDPR